MMNHKRGNHLWFGMSEDMEGLAQDLLLPCLQLFLQPHRTTEGLKEGQS